MSNMYKTETCDYAEPKPSSSHVERKDDLEKTGTIDTIAQTVVSDNIQRYIRRQFDKKLLPIVCFLYVLSYLDRGNIGNAKAAGADKALHLNSSQVRYLRIKNSSYKLIDPFSGLKSSTLSIFATSCSNGPISSGKSSRPTSTSHWGTAAMCSGLVHNMAGLIACRSLLGIFEAGFGAGAPYFLSLFYQRKELGLRISVLLGMAPLANCFAAALAYGITHIQTSWGAWRYLFIIEGLPTILFAPIVYFFLADSPGTAKFLDTPTQTTAIERLATRDTTAKSKVNWKQFFAGIADYQNYIHTIIHFCCNYSFAGLSNFLPTIVADMGYTSINAQGLTAPPYFAAFLLCVVVAFVSDRYGHRGFIVAASSAVGMTGYLILTLVKDMEKTGPRYLGIWLACCGIFPALSINITWLLNNQGGDSKRGAGLAILAIFGQCSSFVSSTVFPKTDAPFYTLGCSLGAGFTGLIVILALGLHFMLERENKRRDALHGPIDSEEQIDVSNLGDAHPKFRYLT
ncbi:probable permease of the major facilitator superfamily [Phialocephala subalpina]|uniref:Probable permease of the major facilitator superfamily n=1 Tax=Phialocephala subalpina TaxID=576137 RepID=A0A1L7WZK3_9HELO|nr:probable permease of the major facilitator superfamily [Phialocephala subalpina]